MAQMANAQQFHRFLGIGATALAIVMIALRTKAEAPLPEDEATTFMAYAFAGISLALVALSVVVLSRRVPERHVSQTLDAYWGTPAVLAAAQLVWFVSEGAAILAIVGYYLTGHLAPAAMMVAGLGVFWWLGPSSFAKP